ncbi:MULTISPECIES: 2-hydroxyacyl-CoA dehydratase subunit D [Pseudothermotoga]|jgi:benzoyl-CoA reductase/2-hydroxyglutaryl-CoA dehydratase subunit BcrC/BadD/HgdB|uniref:2-hydroxyglutaryl-CoA dehydratase D-component n=2 Tax=Pseudothermotoga TaxID=1643951 RepID=A8F7A9_PSELT|nr:MULTISPECIES: 2-hydroxyacyl-CoA dehydratase family protein [Pseudothermotoga]ABV34043.1 2-hydroxyglutaryl-CoA dehydratase D-component [Pseudothermotoga lettingae TMO]MDI3494830.1 hypothetical protein [Pseudothermotoga sp.]MDK2884668.1 hypothetical protein [Pseudothermotoga sp.]GLI49018.1 2-hydroxyacyl-CoA dehydratase,D-component [Pseudothermotoga lettingae TMO]HBJ80391.1 2-hydroxyacyl-CoA dehydratase [Pseudothermotoga sp.]
MSEKSVAFGRFLKKFLDKPLLFKRFLNLGLSAELARRKMAAITRNDFTSWMDFAALKAVQKAVCGDTAWVNLFFPVEIIHAFRLNCVSAEGLSGMFASMLLEDTAITKAESLGISRNLCTFHRTGIGISYSGFFPGPSFVATTNILCDGNIPVFTTYSKLYSVPLYVIDVPRNNHLGSEEYLVRQMEDLIFNIENHLGRKFVYSELVKQLEIEKEALDIMREAYHKLCIRPLPMELYQHVNALYSFHIAPKHYILKAAKSLIKYDKPPENNKKILWLHLAPYYDNELYKIFCRTSKTIVATSEFEWDWLYWQVDPVHPFQSLAKKLMLNPEIGPVEKRIDFVSKLALDFKVDGVIHFNHWGCKQSWGSIHLIKENFEKLGIPFLAIDGDCVDHSNQSSAQFKTRIEAFLEMIE